MPVGTHICKGNRNVLETGIGLHGIKCESVPCFGPGMRQGQGSCPSGTNVHAPGPGQWQTGEKWGRRKVQCPIGTRPPLRMPLHTCITVTVTLCTVYYQGLDYHRWPSKRAPPVGCSISIHALRFLCRIFRQSAINGYTAL